MFIPTDVSLLEIPVRVVLVYASLLILLRLTGKKELGQLSPMDFLTMLILSETVSPVLTKQDTSFTAGILAAATLLGLTLLVDQAVFRSRRLEEFLEGQPRTLIEDGKLDAGTLKREKISRQELDIALRREGVAALDDVARAVLEPTGHISVIKHRP
jgi:uncharacterized membrane protein YcaP (DUF421 family)